LNEYLINKIQIEAAKHDLLVYAKYINTQYETPKHIRQIAEKLQQIQSGKIKRLIINLPPRHGKSWLVNRYFVPWLLGKTPTAKIIVSSYASSLAADFTREARDQIRFEKYNDIFPDTKIDDKVAASDRWQTTEGGIVIGAGVGAGITGRGMFYGIIDDPVKDDEEAMSRTVQEKTWDWYRSTFYTRLEPPEDARIVLIQTRWGLNDLTGKLIEQNPDEWDVLKLPAINENNEALWPERFPISVLNKIRVNVGERAWSALYQQEPVDISERIFDNIKYARPTDDLKLIGYLDPALGGKDYSALTIGGFSSIENKFYIVAGFAWQRQLDETYNYVETVCKMANVQVLAVESNQAQIAIGLELKKRGLIVTDVHNFKNKHFRIMHFVKKHWDRIYFAEPDESGNMNFDQSYIRQVLHYSEIVDHDDAPDSLAGFMQAMFKLMGKKQ
jgi:predicted phage terminase large subunit-like protein